jgi:transposase-like protein
LKFAKTQTTGDQVMAIVTIGNLALQVPEQGSPDFVQQLVKQIEGDITDLVGRFVDESLETEVERYLGRGRYRRRKKAKRREQGAYCSKCRSHQRQDFRRNGHYGRNLVTHWGQISVNLPQVKCQCGGNVKMKYQTVRPRQRIWDDVKVEVLAEYGRGLSYRQIKVDLDQRLDSSVGLRTLNQCVLGTGTACEYFSVWKVGECAPVVRVDGIWITILFTTGESRTDRLGRKRPVKQAKRIPILAAQGLWPTSGKTRLLAWMRAEGEDTDSWQQFLEKLYEAGTTPENGLVMLAADGSQGFRAAYENVYWMVPFQRCVFHKLRNIARATRTPAGLDRQAAHQFRTQFLRSAAQIWQAPDEDQAREYFQLFCHTWQASQSKAIATLRRDFEDTLTFFAVQILAAARGECWPAHGLRTTSPLERMFREFRRRYRSALLFHSEAGAVATTALIAARFS